MLDWISLTDLKPKSNWQGLVPQFVHFLVLHIWQFLHLFSGRFGGDAERSKASERRNAPEHAHWVRGTFLSFVIVIFSRLTSAALGTSGRGIVWYVETRKLMIIQLKATWQKNIQTSKYTPAEGTANVCPRTTLTVVFVFCFRRTWMRWETFCCRRRLTSGIPRRWSRRAERGTSSSSKCASFLPKRLRTATPKLNTCISSNSWWVQEWSGCSTQWSNSSSV